MRRALTLLAGLTIIACAESESTTAPRDDRSGRPARPRVAMDAPLVAFLGDSITAGLHLDDPRREAFPFELQRRLIAAGRPFRVLWSGGSGDTTAGGRSRIDWLLKQGPALLVVELGGNDGLRGIPVKTVEENLGAVLDAAAEASTPVILLGLKLPPNYGAEYTVAFEALYDRLGRREGVRFIPYFMRRVGGIPDMNFKDGLHPNPHGHRRLAENIEPTLRAALDGIKAP